jgi:hypothetical protein
VWTTWKKVLVPDKGTEYQIKFICRENGETYILGDIFFLGHIDTLRKTFDIRYIFPKFKTNVSDNIHGGVFYLYYSNKASKSQ